MRKLMWIVTAVLLVLWTAGTALTAEAVRWAAAALASGQAVDLAEAAARWQPPAWLASWMDTAWLRGAQSLLLSGVEALRDTLPTVGGAIGWAVPLLWGVWAAGALLMLLVALLLHLAIGPAAPPRPSTA